MLPDAVAVYGRWRGESDCLTDLATLGDTALTHAGLEMSRSLVGGRECFGHTHRVRAFVRQVKIVLETMVRQSDVERLFVHSTNIVGTWFVSLPPTSTTNAVNEGRSWPSQLFPGRLEPSTATQIYAAGGYVLLVWRRSCWCFSSAPAMLWRIVGALLIRLPDPPCNPTAR